jgi:hypothetical protein
MFFKRAKPKVYTFSDRLSIASQAGFQTKSIAGKTLATRDGCGAEIIDASDHVTLGRAGIMIGEELGLLTDIGFQKVFQTPTGKRAPALSEQLKALHAFTEDLRQTLDITSLYNQGLGTTNELHVYDRVEGRDAGHS